MASAGTGAPLWALPIEQLIERANVLIEALPYLADFRGCTVVVKYGGAAMVQPELKKAVAQDIAAMAMVGIKVIVVHGGGKEITELLERMGEKTEFIDGQRVTDAAALDAAEMVLAGRVAGEIVALLEKCGARAVGVSGKSAGLLRARKHAGTRDMGFVGEIEGVDPSILHVLCDNGFVPVVSPIGMGEDGQSYNINADNAAIAVALAAKARKLVFLSDIPGVLADPEDPASLIGTIAREEVEPMIASGVVSGGMIPKLRAAAAALDVCRKVHILDGRVPHSLLLELFTQQGIGTQIVRERPPA